MPQDMYPINTTPQSDFIARLREGLYCQTHKAQTRAGYPVTITSDEGTWHGGTRPITGMLTWPDGFIGPELWDKAGAFVGDGLPTEYDLILVPVNDVQKINPSLKI